MQAEVHHPAAQLIGFMHHAKERHMKVSHNAMSDDALP
jgi:hypothetical protein